MRQRGGVMLSYRRKRIIELYDLKKKNFSMPLVKCNMWKVQRNDGASDMVSSTRVMSVVHGGATEMLYECCGSFEFFNRKIW